MNSFQQAVRLLSRMTNLLEGSGQNAAELAEAKAFVNEHLVGDEVVGCPTTFLSEETRYVLCCQRLCGEYFTGEPPKPEDLAELLEKLGVSLEDLEKLVEEDRE